MITRVMILSYNKDDNLSIGNNLIQTSLKSDKNRLTELEITQKKYQNKKTDSLNRCLGQHMN